MEGLLEKSEGELNNIEQMVHSIEFGQLQSEVVERLKVGNEALKSLHKILDIEKIEDILDETREGVEKQRVSRSITESSNKIAFFQITNSFCIAMQLHLGNRRFVG
jgi:predicted RNA binding protein with dsRBD fold (UPF0201 family)